MSNRILLSLFLLAITPLPGNAQIPYFQHYSLLKKNELVQVNRVFQDSDGFIWFGTNKGLFRFNGTDYRRLTAADGLPDDQVTAIAQDSSGRIWTGHRNGKLAFIAKGVVHHFDPSEGSAAEPVSDILFDKKGRLWFSTLNDGLYYYSGERLFRLDELEGMPDLFVYDLLMDEEGRVWAGTDGGVVICALDGNKAALTVLDYSDGLADNIVKGLAPAGSGKILIATEDAGVHIYDPATGSFSPAIEGRWTYGSITDFSRHNNRLWIATSGAGLMMYDEERRKLRRYDTEPGYALPAVTTLLNDREGNLWAGTRSGVLRSSGAGLEFIECPGVDQDEGILAVAVDQDDALWFSTSRGLFKRSAGPAGKILVTQPLGGSPYGRYTVISLFSDDAGYVWAGLYGEGVLRIHPRTGRTSYFSRELRNGNVLSITGSGDVIWLATLGGAERITVSGEKFDVRNFSRQNGLSSDFIYQVFVDSRDRVWFGTDGKGVDMMDSSGLHHFDEGLPSRVVYGFAEDSLRQIWVNVQGNGIHRFHQGKFSPLQANAALRSSDVSCVTSDRYGNLLLAHEYGIDRVGSRAGTIRYFGEEAGIRDMQPGLNAFARDRFGNVYIGTNGGIVRYAMESSAFQQFPDAYIDQLKVFDKPVDESRLGDLDYDENSVTIQFHGFWFQNALGLQYRYKMDNFDEDWILTANNAVTYSRLPPGDYTFRVRSSDNSDFSQAREASLRFSISPPFWETTAFYAGAAGFIVALGYSFVKFRERRLRRDKLILEQRVEERTLEIQRKTEEIQTQNEEIMAQAEEIRGINENLEMLVKERTEELQKKNKALEEYAFINAHKLRGPLASILGLINLIDKTALDAEARVIHSHLQQSADELDSIITSITKAIERGER